MSTDSQFPPIYNRPGLSQLAYRIADYAAFREYLLSLMPQQLPEANYPLSKLTTRSLDDPAIALLDAWAVVGDVLTFYQERIANEGFLRTAIERRSVLELARAIGYELNPGIAASTFLAFLVEEAPNSPDVVTVPSNTPIMSIPGENELPQIFETSAEIVARTLWNRITPRLSRPQVILSSTHEIYLQGISTQLQAGDFVLLVEEQEVGLSCFLLPIAQVEVLAARQLTRITWEQSIPGSIEQPLRNPQVYAFRKRAGIFGNLAPRWENLPNALKHSYGGTVRGGIFRSRNLGDLGDQWVSSSTGLPDLDIRSLTAHSQGDLFAGTPSQGIWRSQDNGEHWSAASTGLSNLAIQVVWADTNGDLYVGTPSGGAFLSKDRGESWTPINTGSVRVENLPGNNQIESVNTALPNTVVRSFATITPPIREYDAITIASISTTVTLSDSNNDLKVGDAIIANNQVRIITNSTSSTIFSIDASFRPNLASGTKFKIGGKYIFAGTDVGVYRTQDNGKNWYFAGLSDRSIRALQVLSITLEFNINITIKAKSNKVEDLSTNYLRKGDFVQVNGQDVLITAVTSGSTSDKQTITLSQSFNTDISAQKVVRYNVNCLFAGSDRGVFWSSDYGTNWSEIDVFRNLSILCLTALGSNTLFVGTETQGAYRSNSVNSSQLNRTDNWSNSLINLQINALSTASNRFIFAGTPDGVFFSSDSGEHWQAVSRGLTNLQITALTAIAQTGKGTLQSNGSRVTGSGTQFTQDLQESDEILVGSNRYTVISIVSDSVLTIDPIPSTFFPSNTAFSIINLFAGTPFAGFVETEWPNFQLKETPIDLDTLYPAILPNSWLALWDGSTFQACQVESIAEVSRQDFSLDTKISRITPIAPLQQSANFRLRETLVLAQSEALILADEQLTIPTQQDKIFQDPFAQEKLYLSQYIPGLKPDQMLILSGKRPQARTEVGGFYRSLNWEARNQGLEDQAIRQVITFGNGSVMASSDRGVYLSEDGGNTWNLTQQQFSDESRRPLPSASALRVYTLTGKINGNNEATQQIGVSASEFNLGSFGQTSAVIQAILTGRTVNILSTLSQAPLYSRVIQAVGIVGSEANPVFALTLDIGLGNRLPTRRYLAQIPIVLAGTDDGLLVWNAHQSVWQQVSDQIKSIQAIALQAATGADRPSDILFASNADRGLWKSENYGVSWDPTPLSTGLVQDIAIDPHSQAIYVAVHNQGIYRSNDSGETWKQFSDTKIGSGSITTSDKTITGNGTYFTQELKPNDILIAAGQAREVETIESDLQITLKTSFNPPLSAPTRFTVRTGLTSLDVTALVIDAASSPPRILAGTRQGGIFQSIDRGEHWTVVNTNLTDKTILSLAIAPHSAWIYAGTAEGGVFRSTSQDCFWVPLNAGLADRSIAAIFTTSLGDVFLGTGNGVFYSSNLGNHGEPIQWERRNQGLPRPNLQAVAYHQTSQHFYLFVGSPDGVFRSGDGGEHWEPVNDGLISLNVQALLVYSGSPSQQPACLLAGTSGGIFRSTDWGESWTWVSSNLTHQTVQTLTQKDDTLLAGMAEGGVFRSTDGGLTWKASGLVNVNVQALTSHADPTNPCYYAGTQTQGLFQSSTGDRWEALITDQPGSGTLSSKGTTVTGIDTRFLASLETPAIPAEIQVGSLITAAEQTRTVTQIISATALTVNEPFHPDLPLGSTFTINNGLTSKNITAIASFTVYEPKQTTVNESTDRDHFAGSVSLNEDSSENLTESISDANLIPESPDLVSSSDNPESEPADLSSPSQNEALEAAKARQILIVGTAGSGLFLSTDRAQHWQSVGTDNLDLLEIRCLTIEAHHDRVDVFAGTARGGVYISQDDGQTWEKRPQGLTNTDVRAIAVDDSHILVAGIGILISPDGFYSAPVTPNDRLWITAPPIQRAMDKEWSVVDIQGFVGKIWESIPEDLQLLPAAKDDANFSEICTIQAPPTDQKQPILTLKSALSGAYDPETLVLYGNVVEATHGETREEAIGSGNGTTDNQRFVLKKPPLTYTPSASGGDSTLKVYVDDVLWEEVRSLYQQPATAQTYIVRLQDDSTPILTFGDGKHGIRLPSGQDNIKALYRSGIGSAGNVAADSLSLLKRRPLGISGVTNPLAATGGADPETLITARSKAPPTVRTLDRIVSLRDFEDFARTFPGIGKAKVAQLWQGSSLIVQLTIAGVDGAEIVTSSELYQSLVQAIEQARDPLMPVQIDSYAPLLFNLEAKLRLDPRRIAEQVLAEIRTVLTQQFSFANRSFGQDVTSAEVIATIQNVPGVIAVDLDALHRQGSSKALLNVLSAELARWDPTTQTIQPAQLLLLNPQGIQLTPEAQP